MALANAGFAVEAVCPSGHPLGTTSIVGRTHSYRGLWPLASFGSAIVSARPDIIVPADDLAASHLHRLHGQGSGRGGSGAAICALIERSLGAPESFPVLFARTSFLELSRELGVRCPKTEVVTSVDDLRTCAAGMGYPLVLKADGSSGGNGVSIVRTFDETEHAFRKLSAPPLLARAVKRTLLDRDSTLLGRSLSRVRSVVNAQAFVAGREATSAIACWKGTVLASLQFEVAQKAKSAGHATVVRVIENEEMSFAAEQIARRLHLSGLHGLDFMIEASTGRAHLIEINPRATQVGHLALGPQCDLPAALYAAVSGKALNPAPKITENDTIALFPQEWIRDVSSPFLLSGYHDVPWQEPNLVRACVLSHRRQAAWYSRRTAFSHGSAAGSGVPLTQEQESPPLTR